MKTGMVNNLREKHNFARVSCQQMQRNMEMEWPRSGMKVFSDNARKYLPEYDMLDGDAMYEELVVGVIAEK